MKRPALYLTILSLSVIFSTVLVSTAVSSLFKSFYKNEIEKNVKVIPADNHMNDIQQASVTLK